MRDITDNRSQQRDDGDMRGGRNDLNRFDVGRDTRRYEERDRERGGFLDEKIDNPLSDTSTWNTELPNIGKTGTQTLGQIVTKKCSADVQLCSSI